MSLRTGTVSEMKVLLVLLACVSIASAGIVEYEPQVPEELVHSGELHPYAMAYKMPLPTYTGQESSSPAAAFESFIEMQTHVPAGSESAKGLSMSPVLIETEASAAAAEDITWVPDDHEMNTENAVHEDPAGDWIENTKYHPLPFDASAGSDNEYRRAVYGLRRRRMPYMQSPMMSLNPFRHPNSFWKTPFDMLEPRTFQPMDAAKNPLMTDFGVAKGRGGRPLGLGKTTPQNGKGQQTTGQTTEQTTGQTTGQTTEQTTQQTTQQTTNPDVKGAEQNPLAVETTNAALGSSEAPPGQISKVVQETTASNSISNPSHGMQRLQRHLAYQDGKGSMPTSFDGLRQLNAVIHARGLSPLASMTPGFGGHQQHSFADPMYGAGAGSTPGFSGQYNTQPGVQGDGFSPSTGPTAGFEGMSGVNFNSNIGAYGHWNPDYTGMGNWAGVTPGDLRQKPLGHFSDGEGVYHPLGSGPSPFIPGMSAFWDWYNPKGGHVSTTPDAGSLAK